MNWTDLVWLLLGLGLGLSVRVRSRQAISAEKAPLPEPPLEQDLQPLLQPLQLAYQLATEVSQFKGGFLARTSHELRSPLNGMIGTQQLILQGLCDSPEEERDFVAQANQSALKMIKVLDHVVDVARLEHGTAKMELQPLQLTALLQSLYDLTCLQAADRNLKLELTMPDPDLYVFADPRRLQQVLLHLVDTAIAEMGEGYIHISAHPVIETECVQLWIDCDRPLRFCEPIDGLQTHSEPEADIPSPGLNFLTSQMLLSLMGGTLTLVEPPLDSEGTRLQCTVPLVMPDPLA